MVAITRDHLAQLLQTILHDLRVGLRPHSTEGFFSPCGDLALHQNAVAIAVVQDAFILRPMDAGEDAIQMLHLRMIALDLFRRLRHAELWIAPRHAFCTHESYGLAIEPERTTYYL